MSNPYAVNDAVAEQYRIQMIENYRQSVALQVMVAQAVKADEDTNFSHLAKRAKRAADELVKEMFGEDHA